MAKKYMKRLLSLLGKYMLKLYFTPIRMTNQKHERYLSKMWKKGNPCALLLEMQISRATMENCIAIPQKT